MKVNFNSNQALFKAAATKANKLNATSSLSGADLLSTEPAQDFLRVNRRINDMRFFVNFQHLTNLPKMEQYRKDNPMSNPALEPLVDDLHSHALNRMAHITAEIYEKPNCWIRDLLEDPSQCPVGCNPLAQGYKLVTKEKPLSDEERVKALVGIALIRAGIEFNEQNVAQLAHHPDLKDQIEIFHTGRLEEVIAASRFLQESLANHRIIIIKSQ